MTIQLNKYFRILVIGQENQFVADIIERDLDFNTRVVPEDQVDEAVRNSADCGAIVVSRASAEAAVKAREERGLRMPIFLLSRRRKRRSWPPT